MPSEVKQRKGKKESPKAENSPKKSAVSTSTTETATDEEPPPPPKYGPMPGLSKHRVISRVALIAGLMAVVWFNSKRNESPLATVDEQIKMRSFKTTCSPMFESSVSKFQGCIPKQCGRFVSDELLSTQEIVSLEQLATRYFIAAPVKGVGTTIFDFHSALLKFDDQTIDLRKLNETKPIFRRSDLLVYQAVKGKLRQLVAQYFGIDQWSINPTRPTFFSRFSAFRNSKPHDSYWRVTAHQKQFQQFHFSTIVFLSDYEKDLQGGRLVFVDSDNTNRTVDPKQGRVVGFSSGEENSHYHERVTEGHRFAFTLGFTCDAKYAMRDPRI